VLMESQDAGMWLGKLDLLELRSRPDYGDGSAAAGLLDAVSGLIEHDEALKETQE
jgi:hypothetical protein